MNRTVAELVDAPSNSRALRLLHVNTYRADAGGRLMLVRIQPVRP